MIEKEIELGFEPGGGDLFFLDGHNIPISNSQLFLCRFWYRELEISETCISPLLFDSSVEISPVVKNY